MKFFSSIVEAVFPNHCVGCGMRGKIVCAACMAKFPSASVPEASFITSVFAYSHPPVRALIRTLKYKNGRTIAGFFAPYVLDSITEFLGEEKLFHGDVAVVFVPIPLSKKRMKKRGYNQSELLIKEMLKHSQIDRMVMDASLVKKIKETTPQAEIKKRAVRLSSQHDCFLVSKNKYLKNEIIILIDDVTTTGATLSAVRNILHKDGFRKVFAFTVAH